MKAPQSVVVGGGIAGLVASYLLAGRGHGVTLLEREPEVGGLLRSFDYGSYGRFDYGTHNIGETGVAELDELLHGLLPSSEWQVLEGERRDLAGTYFGGALHPGSVYPDLRGLPRALYQSCVVDFFQGINAGVDLVDGDARSYLVGRFGTTIADEVLGQVIAKLFGRVAAELDPMATMITSLDRVVLFDEPVMLALVGSEVLRSRLAFPDQRRLPPGLSSGSRSLYPRNYGMYRVIDALRDRLQSMSVTIKCGATLSGLKVRSGRVVGVEYLVGGKALEMPVDGHLVWTTGWNPLGAVLGASLTTKAERPRRTVLANILLDRPLACSGLHYFYCYDPDLLTFRVTNYAAFCSGAARAGGHPVCLEMFVDDAPVLDTEALGRRAENELRRLGVVVDGTQVLFNKVEVLQAGFPLPSLTNMKALNEARAWVESRGIANLLVLGILAQPRQFFQKDVLRHAYRTIAAREGFA